MMRVKIVTMVTMEMMVTRVMIVLPEEYLLLSGLQCASSLRKNWAYKMQVQKIARPKKVFSRLFLPFPLLYNFIMVILYILIWKSFLKHYHTKMIVLCLAFNERYFKNQEVNLLLWGLVRLEGYVRTMMWFEGRYERRTKEEMNQDMYENMNENIKA